MPYIYISYFLFLCLILPVVYASYFVISFLLFIYRLPLKEDADLYLVILQKAID